MPDYPLLRGIELQLDGDKRQPSDRVKARDVNLIPPTSAQGHQAVLNAFYSLADALYKMPRASPRPGFRLLTSSQSVSMSERTQQSRELTGKLGEILQNGLDCKCSQQHALLVYPPVLSEETTLLHFIASLEQQTPNWIRGTVSFVDGGQ